MKNLINAFLGFFRRAPAGPIAGAGQDCVVKVSGDYSICCICATDWDTNDPHPPRCPAHGPLGRGGAGGGSGGAAYVGPHYSAGQPARGSRGGAGGVVMTNSRGERIL